MAFQLSPGVQVTEKDLTAVVPAVGTSIGGTAINASWGPINQIVTISSENELVSTFGSPPATLFENWWAAASFLSYTSNLKVVRAADTADALNAGSISGVLIENSDVYSISHQGQQSSANGIWAAKYAGAFGNSISVSFADSKTWSIASGSFTGTVTTTVDATTVTGSGTAFLTELHVGAVIKDTTGATIGTVSAIASDTAATLAANGLVAVTGAAVQVDWAYKGQFDYAPSTTVFSAGSNAVGNDELHIIIIDRLGFLTGTPNTILERFAGVSKASNAKDSNGSSNYYKNVINERSRYIWQIGFPTANWGGLSSTTFDSAQTSAEIVTNLTGGASGVVTDSDWQTAFNLFSNDELVDVNLVFTGSQTVTVSNYVVTNVGEARKDCMVFSSPLRASVVGRTDSAEAANIVAETSTRSSFAVKDSGWKYILDRYSDVYRWVPCNGDTAGLCARTDAEADPWFSPAGYNRGRIKNVVKLAYTPNKTARDAIYKAGVNPIVGFPGSGIVLFGDKTMLEKPSAFDRINVRRLFITIEKAIATAAKFQLFEFNDAFTRAQFRNLIEPYLRDVQGRRGITNFKVVCDTTNNTSQVIDTNSFVADIFIQPARSINFIQLNFVATRTGVSFEERV